MKKAEPKQPHLLTKDIITHSRLVHIDANRVKKRRIFGGVTDILFLCTDKHR